MIIRRRRNSAFTIVPNALLADSRLSIEARWLIAYLLSKPDDWEVRIPEIQTAAGVGRNKAYQMVAEAVGAGYLHRVADRSNDGKMLGYSYDVYDEPPAQPLPGIGEVASPNRDTVSPFTGSRKTVSRKRARILRTDSALRKDSDQGLKSISAESRESEQPFEFELTAEEPVPSKQPKRSKAALEAEAAQRFESDFWPVYPRRTGKKAARAKFVAIVSRGEATADQIVRGAMRYAAARTGEEERYTKQPVTWLNQGCWDDEYPPPRRDRSRFGDRPKSLAEIMLEQTADSDECSMREVEPRSLQ